MKQPRDSDESESQAINTKRQRWTEEETHYLKVSAACYLLLTAVWSGTVLLLYFD
jgi:hypothetical protein